MKEQEINRIQGQDQVTWLQNEDLDQSDTKSDHSDAKTQASAQSILSPYLRLPLHWPHKNPVISSLEYCLEDVSLLSITTYSWKIDSFLFKSYSRFCIEETLSGKLPPSLPFCKCNSEKQPPYIF